MNYTEGELNRNMLKHPVGLNWFVFKPEIWEIWPLFITVLPWPLCFISIRGNEQTYLDFNTLKSKVSPDSGSPYSNSGIYSVLCFLLSPCWTSRILGLQNCSVEVQIANSRVISCRYSKEESWKGNTEASCSLWKTMWGKKKKKKLF